MVRREAVVVKQNTGDSREITVIYQRPEYELIVICVFVLNLFISNVFLE